MEPVYKIHPDYPNYGVTEDGRVWGIKRGKFLKPQKTRRGYLKVMISKKAGEKQNNVEIHRLVALLYIPNLENKPEVNHKDGDKTNNTKNNLEWATESENQLHRAWVLGKRPPKGKDHHLSVTVYQYDYLGNLISEYGAVREAARVLNVSPSGISNASLNNKAAYGYFWSFEKL